MWNTSKQKKGLHDTGKQRPLVLEPLRLPRDASCAPRPPCSPSHPGAPNTTCSMVSRMISVPAELPKAWQTLFF